VDRVTDVRFEIRARDGAARAGRLHTPHGPVDTPAFMPVATYGAVRGVAPDELAALGAQMLLANTYHLHERPGESVVASQGGLHGFTGWRGAWLTDSGGYQVTSLAARVRVDEQGVTFASPLDGRLRTLTPESAVAVQEALGADVAMVLDECQRGEPEEWRGGAASLRVRAAGERTLRWAARARAARRRTDQALFGIVQGGACESLRRRLARATAELGFEGFAHGGLGLGEDPEAREALVAAAHAELPPEAPRYLMGIGRPADLVGAIGVGVDLFDCVLPTRHGRHGVLFTRRGLLKLRHARFRDDAAPPDAACDCPACTRHTRAYLHHLLRAGEMLGARLASLHNLRFYLGLLAETREAIAAGRFGSVRARVAALGDAEAD
jgi:queuine tRNA-ribosyltransferase